MFSVGCCCQRGKQLLLFLTFNLLAMFIKFAFSEQGLHLNAIITYLFTYLYNNVFCEFCLHLYDILDLIIFATTTSSQFENGEIQWQCKTSHKEVGSPEGYLIQPEPHSRVRGKHEF